MCVSYNFVMVVMMDMLVGGAIFFFLKCRKEGAGGNGTTEGDMIRVPNSDDEKFSDI